MFDVIRTSLSLWLYRRQLLASARTLRLVIEDPYVTLDEARNLAEIYLHVLRQVYGIDNCPYGRHEFGFSVWLTKKRFALALQDEPAARQEQAS